MSFEEYAKQMNIYMAPIYIKCIIYKYGTIIKTRENHNIIIANSSWKIY